VVAERLPEPHAADVEPELMRPPLESGVVRQLSRRFGDAQAEHGFAAQTLDAVDAADEVDEDDR
jgi:hypothetical protein